MSNVEDRAIVARHVIDGRALEVERIEWKDSDGLSFDVIDSTTRETINNESYDDEPDAGTIAELLYDYLRDD